jgi:hypothetical protein
MIKAIENQKGNEIEIEMNILTLNTIFILKI